MDISLNDLRKYAGDEVAEDHITDLLDDARTAFCTCVPGHRTNPKDWKCPVYVEKLETLLRKIRQTGFIRNTAHKLRAEIDEVLQ